jgi:hypothetical protein
MRKNQLVKVLSVLRAAYDGKFSLSEEKAELWMDFFQNYEYEEMLDAVKKYITVSTSPPTPADLFGYLSDAPDPDQAWAQAVDYSVAMSRSGGGGSGISYAPGFDAPEPLHSAIMEVFESIPWYEFAECQPRDRIALRAQFVAAYKKVRRRLESEKFLSFSKNPDLKRDEIIRKGLPSVEFE